MILKQLLTNSTSASSTNQLNFLKLKGRVQCLSLQVDKQVLFPKP